MQSFYEDEDIYTGRKHLHPFMQKHQNKKLTLSTETISGHYIVGSLQDLCSVVHLVINNGYCGKAL